MMETSDNHLNKKQGKKASFGREGANVERMDENGKAIHVNNWVYSHHNVIYQEYADFAEDENKTKYQAGLFFAYESCGLGVRCGGESLDNYSKFVGHIIKD